MTLVTGLEVSSYTVYIPVVVGILNFALPLLLGGLGALGGAKKNKVTSEQSNKSVFNRTDSSDFNRTSEGGFGDFDPIAQNIIQTILGSFGGGNLDPNQLNVIEQVLKGGANRRANQLNQDLVSRNLVRGLGDSQGAQQAALGFSDAFRGQQLGDISANIAQQRFQLPIQQEQIDASQRSGLSSLLSLIPQTRTETGSSTGVSSGTSSGTSTGVNSAGGGLSGAIAGGIGGFDIGNKIGQNLGLNPIFGGSGNTGGANFGATPSLQSVAGNIPAPNINPSASTNPILAELFRKQNEIVLPDFFKNAFVAR